MPQPVSLLLRQSLMLKDAVQECLKDPAPKPVHRLRSTTRRIEATLKLLSLSSSLPDLQEQTKPLAKRLRGVRRAAAKVRDLDVHLDLLKKYRENRDGDDEEMSRARNISCQSQEESHSPIAEKPAKRPAKDSSRIRPPGGSPETRSRSCNWRRSLGGRGTELASPSYSRAGSSKG